MAILEILDYGLDTLISIIYTTQEPTPGIIKELMGKDLETIDSEWETWIKNRYLEIEGAGEVANAYRSHTSWYQYCSS